MITSPLASQQPMPVYLASPVLGSLMALRKALNRGEAELVRRLAARFKQRYPNYEGYCHEALSQAFEQEDDTPNALLHARKALEWFQGVSIPSIHRYVRLAREADALREARETVEATLLQHPDDPVLRLELGRLDCAEGRPEDGLAVFAAFNQEPRCEYTPELRATVFFLMAEALFALGQHEDAEFAYTTSLEYAPNFATCWHNRLFAAHYMPHITAEALAALPKATCRALYGDCLSLPPDLFERARDPHRPLRIGIFSGGLRTHPVGWMAGPVLHAMRQHGEVTYIMYNTGKQHEPHDTLRLFFQDMADDWHDVAGWNDEKLYQHALDSTLDIAIDMSGHGDGSRLLPFVQRVAPVQIKWLGGMFCSTGVPAMDYLLTDAVQTPEGSEPLYTEQLVRLPRGYVGYAPPPYMPEVGPSPHLEQGYVTFGCCNNALKLNPQIIAVWADILNRVPHSRLLLKSDKLRDEAQMRHLEAQFVRHGIDRKRLIIEGQARHAALLETYNRIDISLDTWPYTGGLTTLEALWMGVPVITTPGPSFAGRHAAGHLYHVGLEECVAPDFSTYIELAVALAMHSEALVRIRTTLRARMAHSPLLRHDLLASDLLAALRVMWQRFCAGQPPAPIALPPVSDPQAPDEELEQEEREQKVHDCPHASTHSQCLHPLEGDAHTADMMTAFATNIATGIAPNIATDIPKGITAHMPQAARDLYLRCCARRAGEILTPDGIRLERQASFARVVRARALPELESANPADAAKLAICCISTFILEIGRAGDAGIRTGDVVLDCGAGDGHLAVWAGMTGARTVWALERVDRLPTLERNAARYNGTPPWLHPAELPDLAGPAFPANPTNPGSLDAWCAARSIMPDTIHLNLGADTLPALMGAVGLLARHPRMVVRVRQEDVRTVPEWLISVWPTCRLDCRLDAEDQLVVYVSEDSTR